MLDKNIEELIREYIQLKPSTSGWESVYCEVCGDGSRTKGPRGGFKFSGDEASYHCFNCGCSGNFVPSRDIPISRGMREALEAFGIPKNEYNAIAYAEKVLGDGTTKKSPKSNSVQPAQTIEVPDYFYLLQTAKKSNIMAEKAMEELSYRNINPNDYPFYLSNGKSKKGPKEDALARSMMGRLIIPFYDKDGNLIYYQGRLLGENKGPKYINANVPKKNIIYGGHRLTINRDSPLYVTEGFFDAYHLNGVSVQENNMTFEQIKMLEKSPRKKVLVPDRNSDSSKMVDQFIDMGWSITVPDIGSCKDIDEAIRRYGKLYTAQQVSSNIMDNAKDAKIMMKLGGYLK